MKKYLRPALKYGGGVVFSNITYKTDKFAILQSFFLVLTCDEEIPKLITSDWFKN